MLMSAHLGHPRSRARRVWKETSEFLEQVGMLLEQNSHLVVHLVDALVPLPVHVEDLQEGLVNMLIILKPGLDLVHVVDGLIELHRLFLLLQLMRLLLLSLLLLLFLLLLVLRQKLSIVVNV